MAVNYCIINRLNLINKYNLLIRANFKLLSIRNSSYQNSKPVGPIEQYTSDFETVRKPAEWKYVERLLAPLYVPTPTTKTEYPSDWKPPNVSLAQKQPYFVSRSKNHMIPVYLVRTYRGTRRITKLKRVHGDIFKLNTELKEFLMGRLGKEVATSVNELIGSIQIKGDHVRLVQEYLLEKGF